MKRKLLLLALFAQFCSLTTMAYDAKIDGIYYEFFGSNATVVSGDDPYSGDVTIPSDISYNGKNYVVTEIGHNAFYACRQLETLRIPNCTISSHCFYACKNLSSVTFYGTERPYVIKSYAFNRDENLKTVSFSEGLSEIGLEAFGGCNKLESISFPKSLKKIDKEAFNGCYDLQSIKFQEGIDTIGSNAFDRCGSSSMGNKEIIFPKGLKYIGKSAFQGCSNLKNVSFPESLEYIGSHAFSGCSLNAVNIPANVNFIGSAAFVANYPAIEQIFVDNGNIKYDSREDCSCIIETATGILMAGSQSSFIPDGIREIGESAFCYCDKLTSAKFTIPEGVTNIGYGAFWECRELLNFEIPSSVTYIGEDAFLGTAWYNYQGDGFLYKNGWLLGYKGMKMDVVGSYSIKDGTKGIASRTFWGCGSLTDVVLPHGMKTIGEGAFSDCSALTTISIPNTVTSIGDNAFEYCTNLSSITIPNGVLRVGEGTFQECSALTTISIPNTITSIGDNAFFGCMSLTSVTIPETVSAIGSCAFYYCTSLTSTNIPTNVTNIGESAFERCNNLTNVTISEGVKSIGNRAFCSCESLTSVTIPKTISAIGSCAFLGCTGLMDITSMIRYPFPIDSDVFDDYVSTNSTLHVPARTSRQYMETEGWNRFENIVELDNEDDEDGIVITPLTTANIENTYNSSGCKHSTPQKGINIIRMSDGTTKKVLVR